MLTSGGLDRSRGMIAQERWLHCGVMLQLSRHNSLSRRYHNKSETEWYLTEKKIKFVPISVRYIKFIYFGKTAGIFPGNYLLYFTFHYDV